MRVISSVKRLCFAEERRSTSGITLTLTLSRSTGRGDQSFYFACATGLPDHVRPAMAAPAFFCTGSASGA